jgi:hypothetical protein
MVVRRIREHVATHNWFAVSVDLAIVVVGVFLGTQATNWNDARLAANEAHTYRERLIEDVRTNLSDLAARQVYYQDVRKHALSALAVLDGKSATAPETFLIDAYQASQINSRRFRRSTYDELVAAGALSNIGQQSLRDVADTYYQGLAVLDADIQRLPPYRERVRREIPYDVIDRIRERCGDQVSEVQGTVIFRLPANCKLGLDTSSIDRAVVRLKTAEEMDRDLSRYIVDLDLRLSNLRNSERRGHKFIAALRQANRER